MAALLSTTDKKSASSVRAPQFECVIDIGVAREWAARAEDALARGVATAVLIHRSHTRQWCMVQDALGKTIYASDVVCEVGDIYDFEEINLVYHDVPVPCLIYILRESSHEEAEAVYGEPLSKRRHYYEVMAD